VRAVLAGLVAVLLIVIGSAVPASGEPEEGIRVEGSVTYEVQPDDERIRVTLEVDLTNLTPDRGLTYYYFDEIGVPAPVEATNVSARRVGGETLSTGSESTDDPQWQVITVRLSPVLRYGQPQELEISYDLPNLEPRSDGWTRVMPAIATFLVVPYGDRGHADVEIIVPDSYEDVHVGGAQMSSRKDGGTRVYAATGIDEPEEWWAIVAARDGSLLEQREVEVGDHTAVLKYWPGDDKWADFASEIVTNGIPELEYLIGRSWPVEDELEIVESGVPHAYGFGGWYDSSSDVVEVGDALHAQVMLHELSHAWFNYELGRERWFGEGLAELYSNLALERLDRDVGQPEEVSTDHEHALPLASWEEVVREAPAEDEYAYPASWWVISEIYDEIGREAFQQALASGFDSTIPYVGNTEPEIVRGIIDWKRTLDLFEVVGGSTGTSELYEKYVIDQDDAELLVERAEAREVYDEFVAASAGWGAPYELREAMTYWQFDDVSELVDASQQVLALRDEVIGILAGFDTAGLPALEEAYASARPITDVLAEAELYADVANVLADAQARPAGVSGALAEIGLIGADAGRRLAHVATDLASGEIERAQAESDAVLADVDQAQLIGAVVVGEVAAGLALFWPLRAMTKRRRRATAIGSDSWPTDEPSSSLSAT
jgi:hypothetical protein